MQQQKGESLKRGVRKYGLEAGTAQEQTDEFHMLLECPMYNDLRQKYNQLFLEAGVALPTTGNQICLAIQGDSSVQALMAVQDQDTLARFIKECLQKRRSLRH